MAKDIVVVGAGGFGREVLCLIRDINRAEPGTWNFLGFVASDPPNPEVLSRIEAEYLGSDQDTDLLAGLRGAAFAVAIGKGQIRKIVHGRLLEHGLEPAVLVHPSAVIGEDVEIGAGTVICAGCILTTNIRVGIGVQINLLCTVGHDVVIGDFVTMTPDVNISGIVTLEDFVYMGTNASTVQDLRIGKGTVVGAGAVVAGDLPSGVTAVGIPARPRK